MTIKLVVSCNEFGNVSSLLATKIEGEDDDLSIMRNHEEETAVGLRRRGCSYQKGDFLPEESFKTWDNYTTALMETPHRLMDRLLTRSGDQAELDARARSQTQMKKTLTWWDLIWFGMGAVVGTGIFVLTGLGAREDAGPAVVLSYVISGASALMSVFCYTEFAVEIPVAGDFVAFIAAGNILLEYVIGGAAVARSWTSYFATLCNYEPNDFRITAHGLAKDYNHLDPIAVGVIAIICIIAVVSTKGSSRINYVASVVHIIIILFIIICGLINADTENYKPFAPKEARGVFKASAMLFFAYVGFDAVATMAEETKNPAKDIPIGLVGSMVITTTLYCMYLTHIARTHMMPPWFAIVDAKTGTPVNATIVMLMATAVVAFFTKLDILSNLLSISTLFIFMLVAIALLVRRYYVTGVTTAANRNKLIACLLTILLSSCATAAYWGISEHGWIGYYITVPVWAAGTTSLWIFVPQAREPKMWGVPLVPWLPSSSIAINIFLLGSIDKDSFIRFAAWTGLLLMYYFLFGLHAAYDTAREVEKQWNKVEEGKEMNKGFENKNGLIATSDAS
ncbi:Amino acid/polyamine transporter I [Cynara cardunculus var. scolymus]|uniref:Amino acid/polyamine transporter I n=1 Tax=Cynara cardunculus var. scolymus TaxID=59895 RepID=A0A124R667_CYNCS|nr:Amino acid/polyamine transporter I [Cynara cardunculus var. scolymus]